MDALEKFFGVALKGQTYMNMLYLLLAFPLGLFYFVFLVTGLSAGLGLTIVWVGLLILAGVFASIYGMIALERQMAIGMLHEDILPMSSEDLTGKTLWQKFLSTLRNPVFWKGLAYLFAKFPLGLVSFIALVTLLSVSLALITVPLYYQYFPPQIGTFSLNGVNYYSLWTIDTLQGALIACVLGLLLLVVSMHLFNGLAWVSGKFARVTLGNYAAKPAAVIAPAQPSVSPTIENSVS